jgi:hypothetical protein
MKREFQILVACLAGSTCLLARDADNFLGDSTQSRGGRIGWARLITTRVDWQRHARSDPKLTDFIYKQTSLNIDATWYSADPEKLEQLSAFPLVFVNDLREVRRHEGQQNLAEYLQRGGFLIIDACQGTEKEPKRFLREHIEYFHALLPEATVRELPKEHPVFSCYFELREHPPHTWIFNATVPELSAEWLATRFNGVSVGERMVALISLSALQCGWDGYGRAGADIESMRALVNIYVYAMSQ